MAGAASTDWRETIAPGEEARHVAFAERIREVQTARTRASADKKTRRALHAKAQLDALATFEVLPDLPAPARAGVFAEAKTYRAYVRFSNGSPSIQHDKVGDARGIAIKIVGVEGKKVIPGMEDAKTQDFLLVRGRTLPFRDAREFTDVVTAVAGSKALALPRILARLGFGRALALLKTVGAQMKEPLRPLASTRFYSPAPVRCGDYAVRFELAPRDPEDERRGPLDASELASFDHLGEGLRARLGRGEVAWDFRLQFYVDDQRTPIEDPTVEWKYDDAPAVTVARLTIARGEPSDAIQTFVESLSFDPWHALVAHKPLGEIMRARNHAYRLANEARKPAAEPDGTETAG